jgi:hypothetical protein
VGQSAQSNLPFMAIGQKKLDEMGTGRNGNWAKWELGELGTGRIGTGRIGNWANWDWANRGLTKTTYIPIFT